MTSVGHERPSISRIKTSKPKPITPTTRPKGKISVCFKIYGKPKYSIFADSKHFLIDLICMEHKINKQLAFWSMLKIIIRYKIEIHGRISRMIQRLVIAAFPFSLSVSKSEAQMGRSI